MPLLVWNDTYSVGIEQIDTQHRKLVDVLNRLHDHCLEGYTYVIRPRADMQNILKELCDYAKEHFAYEEKLMEQFFNFPGYEEHKEGHAQFVQKIKAHKERFEQNQEDADELLNFLFRWITHHILRSDKEYVQYLQSKELS